MATNARDIQFATRYDRVLDQIFTLDSVTDRYVNSKYSFKEGGGTASIYVRTVDTTGSIKPYDPTDMTDSYGGRQAVPSTLKNYLIQYNIGLKSSIDEIDLNDTAGQMEAGRVLTLITKEQYVPLVDMDRFATATEVAEGWGGENVVTFDPDHGYENVLDARMPLIKAKSNVKNQVLFVDEVLYKAIKKDLVTFMVPQKNDKIITSEPIGLLDGIPTVLVPSTYFCTRTVEGTAPNAAPTFDGVNTGVHGVLWDSEVLLGARKLRNIRTKMDSEFFDGALLLGHFRFGNYVLDANGNKKAVSVIKEATTTPTP